MIKIIFFCAFLVFKEVLVASPPGDVVGKLNIGYQGWFTCAGDNSPVNLWYKWSNFERPSPGHQTFDLWPDVTEYTKKYQTGYAKLGNGQNATLFSSYDDQTVQVHFNWIRSYGIDGVALERFGANFGNDGRILPYVNGITNKIMSNAVRTNKTFYITYDLSRWNNYTTELKTDFVKYVSNYTKSSAYAKQNGKPVIGVWGFGVTSDGVPVVPGTPAQALDIINYLKSNGLYVIGGVPQFWRQERFSAPGYRDVYTAFNMISPWVVGGFGGLLGAMGYQTVMLGDLLYLNARNIDYQPVLWPGFSWANWNANSTRNAFPRMHGDFMWQQFVNLRQIGIRNAYVAMFDEYNEGTAIAKAAETAADIPTNQWFLTLNADGVKVSSDFYLRLTNNGNKMMKGLIPLRLTHLTPFT